MAFHENLKVQFNEHQHLDSHRHSLIKDILNKDNSMYIEKNSLATNNKDQETFQQTPQNSIDFEANKNFSPAKSRQQSHRYNNATAFKSYEDSQRYQEQKLSNKNISENFKSDYSTNIQTLPSDAHFFSLYEINTRPLNNIQRIKAKRKYKNSNSTLQKRSFNRAGLHEARNKLTSTSHVVKIIEKSRLPSSTGGEIIWKKLCSKLLKLSPQHRGLMTITDVFESQKKFYIISENLQGGELFEFLLCEKAVPEELCKYIIKQILQTLDFLHSHCLVHRDVKPENLMFRRPRPRISLVDSKESNNFDNCDKEQKTRSMTSLECSQTMSLEELSNIFELVLIDFDTCKMTDMFSSQYEEVSEGRRHLVGTYGYLAPEVLKGAEYNCISDLWSVGVILYILITGAPPVPMELMVNAQTSLDALEQTRQGGINFQLAPFPEFPKARDLCRGLLEFNPMKRIATASQALSHCWLKSTASNTVPIQTTALCQMKISNRLAENTTSNKTSGEQIQQRKEYKNEHLCCACSEKLTQIAFLQNQLETCRLLNQSVKGFIPSSIVKQTDSIVMDSTCSGYCCDCLCDHMVQEKT